MKKKDRINRLRAICLNWFKVVFSCLASALILESSHSNVETQGVAKSTSHDASIGANSVNLNSFQVDLYAVLDKEQVADRVIVSQHHAAVEILLTSAKEAMSKGFYTTPLRHNAFQMFQSVLLLDPTNTEALDGVATIRLVYLYFLEKSDNENNINLLRSYLRRARGVGVSKQDIAVYDKKLIESESIAYSGISGVKAKPALNASASETLFNLRKVGRAYQSQKLFPEAIPVYQKLVSINADNSNDWLGLAVSLDSVGSFESARNAYKKVISLNHPNSKIIAFSKDRIRDLEANALQ